MEERSIKNLEELRTLERGTPLKEAFDSLLGTHYKYLYLGRNKGDETEEFSFLAYTPADAQEKRIISFRAHESNIIFSQESWTKIYAHNHEFYYPGKTGYLRQLNVVAEVLK